MNLKNLLVVLSLTVLASACTNSATSRQASSFVSSMPDVPLPENFEVDPTTGSFFDSAEGRIAEMYAAGFKSPEEVGKFYNKIMPQFGWKETADLTYQKEGETLVIEPEKGQYLTTVKYQLRPNI